MRINTITNWAYGATLLLTGVSAAAFLEAGRAAQAERAAIEQHLTYAQAADDLTEGAAAATDAARLVAMRGDARHLAAWRHTVEVERRRDRALAQVRRLDTAPAERAAIAEAERGIVELDQIHADGVEAATRGDLGLAQSLLFGADHERALATVGGGLGHFEALVTARASGELREAQRESDRASLLAKVMIGLTALVFLAVLYFVLKRRVARPLARLTNVVLRLARQDFAVEVPRDHRHDEIGDITDAVRVFRENGLARERLEAERRADQALKDSILQMVHRLQACQSREELAGVVACFAPQAYPELAGRLYLLNEGRNALEQASTWLSPTGSLPSFPPTACWSVRRGRVHACTPDGEDVACLHLADASQASLCVPLMAQGETIGLLYFEGRRSGTALADARRQFLDLLSDNVALALANLRLRERLSELADRDGLTGLLNRRKLDQDLAALIPTTEVACIMADIDHFKRFNDEFGHDAGDAVMQHVAHILRQGVEGVGRAYRFGGEEFTLLLPEHDAAAAAAIAEEIRARIATNPFVHLGRSLGHITISLGVAASSCTSPPQTLLRCADAALLEAKGCGRNRAVVANDMTASPDRTAA